ncbi:histidine ammonia-lyase [Silvibacterium dinghuense]|uniref:Histidine ammonia-lyase n=1 Tax=Silvibacterium dinghuense TaxID=1560006 RepID=A0A4Q1SHW1_9BACT|nr:histidine ammonia-lyase [Silvibacterium dinghuense]RXS97164.1 histidine ammonia-lyase [Silvibacterium dinghuense]GGG96743.1 histidine ammonia-lyase [Silvibacterium dinghuense]
MIEPLASGSSVPVSASDSPASYRLLLDGQPLTLEELAGVAVRRLPAQLTSEALQRIAESRAIVENLVGRGETAYGINTGFGKLSDVHIGPDQLEALQRNLVRSHACGLGEPLPEDEVRAMLLLRANVLAKGFSGVRPIVAETLVALLNTGVHPVIPARGSVGASGDLAPLAHLALTLIGEGDAFYQGRRIPSAEALRQAGIAPLTLAAKEGLALLNGTQAMAGVGGLALVRARRVTELFDLAGAMSLEALRGTPAAFDARIHTARPHAGQMAVASHLRTLLEQSEIRESHRHDDPRVQDAYCLRCMPQVHGAARGALAHVQSVIEIETGSATDNPLIFGNEREGTILSGGNFHGAPLALAFDYAAIALTDLMSISERRIDRLINPDINEGLPAFLSPEAGVSSGLMIVHVAAAALLNDAKVLSHPSSVDSVPTSGGKEDHVSMGMTGALKLRRIVEHAECVLAMELLSAAQGLEYRLPLRPARAVEHAATKVREFVAPLREDRVLSGEIEQLAQAIREGHFDEWRG